MQLLLQLDNDQPSNIIVTGSQQRPRISESLCPYSFIMLGWPGWQLNMVSPHGNSSVLLLSSSSSWLTLRRIYNLLFGKQKLYQNDACPSLQAQQLMHSFTGTHAEQASKQASRQGLR